MGRRSRHLLLPAYALVAAGVVALDLHPVLSAVFAAPLVLLVPGWAVRMALGLHRDVDSPARGVVHSVAISMAIVILGGLVLNALFTLTGTSWTVWLVAVTCLSGLVAWVRDRRAGVSRSEHYRRRPVLSASAWRVAAVAVVVAAAVAGAAVLTETSSRNLYNKPVTQLSLVPEPNTGGRVRVTVTNISSDRVDLVLTIRRSRGRSAAIRLRLGPSATWMRSERAARGRLVASLSRPGQHAPMSVVVWQPWATGI